MRFLLIDSHGSLGLIIREKTGNFSSLYNPPLGLLYIGKSLEDEGHKVEVIHTQAENSFYDNLPNKLKNIDCVGISITSMRKKKTKSLTEKISEIDSSIPIVIGGPFCTLHPKRSLEYLKAADISVEGDGDFVIKDIAKAIEGKKKLSNINGVYYREKDQIKKGKKPKIITNLDELPFPARHLVEKYDYGKVRGSYLFKPKVTSMISSRGCPFKCRFCSRNAISYKTYRERSAENVFKEIKLVSEKYKSLFIVDDNFLVNKKRAHQIFDKLIKEKSDLDLLINGARVDSADKDLYKKMKKAGVKYIEYGIESGNQDVLDYYRKGFDINQIKKAVKLSRKMNFITMGNFILGAPFETKTHFEKTIEFARSLPLDLALFFPLAYMDGSDLWNDAVKKGVVSYKYDEFGQVINLKENGLSNFSHKELKGYCNNAVKKFYYRPSYFLRQIMRSILRKDFRLLSILLSFGLR